MTSGVPTADSDQNVIGDKAPMTVFSILVLVVSEVLADFLQDFTWPLRLFEQVFSDVTLGPPGARNNVDVLRRKNDHCLAGADTSIVSHGISHGVENGFRCITAMIFNVTESGTGKYGD